MNVHFQAADIWSLGVTLYSIVVGKVPFHDENILALYSKIKTQKLEFPDDMDLSPEVIDLVSLMLIKDPAQRITLDDIKVRNSPYQHQYFGHVRVRKENCQFLASFLCSPMHKIGFQQVVKTMTVEVFSRCESFSCG